jgi:hypothetical protein
MPYFKGLLEKIIHVHQEIKRKDNLLDWQIDVRLICKEFNGSQTFEPIRAISYFEIIIVDGVTVEQLFEIIKNAVDLLKKCPQVPEEQRRILLQDAPYPPLEQHIEMLQQIADEF